MGMATNIIKSRVRIEMRIIYNYMEINRSGNQIIFYQILLGLSVNFSNNTASWFFGCLLIITLFHDPTSDLDIFSNICAPLSVSPRPSGFGFDHLSSQDLWSNLHWSQRHGWNSIEICWWQEGPNSIVNQWGSIEESCHHPQSFQFKILKLDYFRFELSKLPLLKAFQCRLE